MILKYRILLYCVVGLTIPVLSFILYPQLGLFEPVSFVGLVLVAALVIETVYHHQGKK